MYLLGYAEGMLVGEAKGQGHPETSWVRNVRPSALGRRDDNLDAADRADVDALRSDVDAAIKRFKSLQEDADPSNRLQAFQALHQMGARLRRLKNMYPGDPQVESILQLWRGYMASINSLQIQIYHIPDIQHPRVTCVPWTDDVYAQMLNADSYEVVPIGNNLAPLVDKDYETKHLPLNFMLPNRTIYGPAIMVRIDSSGAFTDIYENDLFAFGALHWAAQHQDSPVVAQLQWVKEQIAVNEARILLTPESNPERDALDELKRIVPIFEDIHQAIRQYPLTAAAGHADKLQSLEKRMGDAIAVLRERGYI